MPAKHAAFAGTALISAGARPLYSPATPSAATSSLATPIILCLCPCTVLDCILDLITSKLQVGAGVQRVCVCKVPRRQGSCAGAHARQRHQPVGNARGRATRQHGEH